MYLTAAITLAALFMYCWVLANVSLARTKYQIMAPTMDGPLPFLCVMRVAANTVEQLVLFLPSLWLCAYYAGDRQAAIAGAVWVVARVIYALGYYQAPKRRAFGFILSTVAIAYLMIAAGYALARHGVAAY